MVLNQYTRRVMRQMALIEGDQSSDVPLPAKFVEIVERAETYMARLGMNQRGFSHEALCCMMAGIGNLDKAVGIIKAKAEAKVKAKDKAEAEAEAEAEARPESEPETAAVAAD